jgi:hypothetical protein
MDGEQNKTQRLFAFSAKIWVLFCVGDFLQQRRKGAFF